MNLNKKTENINLYDVIKDVFKDRKDIIKIDDENTISETVGRCKARDLLKENYNIVSLLESDLVKLMRIFKQIGKNNNNIIIVYKDSLNTDSKNKAFSKFLRKFKNKQNNMSVFKTYFENIGFKYVGPIEKNNVDKIKKELEKAKKYVKPIFVHVTDKEKIAEKDILSHEEEITVVNDLARDYKKIVVITTEDNESSFKSFKENYSERLFLLENFDSDEFNTIIGMARSGIIPFVLMDTESMIKGYEKIMYNASEEKLPIVACIQNKSLKENLIDYSYLNTIPNLNVMAPKNKEEFEKMVEFSIKNREPAVIKMNLEDADFGVCRKVKEGKAELIGEGSHVTIVAIGDMVKKAVNISKLLDKEKISCDIINARFLKPIDRELINNSIEKTGFLVTLENNLLSGGLGLSINSLLETEVKILNIGISDSQFEMIRKDEKLIDDIFDEEKIASRIEKLVDIDLLNKDEKITTLREFEVKTNDKINESEKKKVGNL